MCDVSLIHAAGGLVTAGLGIYDTIQYISAPVATWCVGQACSMGALLLAGGAAGMRSALPHSRIMVHQPSGHAGVSDICCTCVCPSHEMCPSRARPLTLPSKRRRYSR